MNITDEMKKKVEERIAELSNAGNVKEFFTGKHIAKRSCNKMYQVSKSNKGGAFSQDMHDMDVIFEKETAPIINNFHQLSSCTKQNLTKNLGIAAYFHATCTGVKTLGKPLKTREF